MPRREPVVTDLPVNRFYDTFVRVYPLLKEAEIPSQEWDKAFEWARNQPIPYSVDDVKYAVRALRLWFENVSK